MAVDACSIAGLKVPELSEETKTEIKNNLTDNIRNIAALGNPADLTGSSIDDDFFACARVLGASPEVDCVIILLLPYIPGITLDIGVKLSGLSRQFNKPFIAYVPQVQKYDMLIEGFELNGIPVSPSIEGAVLMAKALMRKKPC